MKREYREKLRQSGVAIVYLFGSRATGLKTRLSDVDIGVVLKILPNGRDNRSLYNDLYDVFSELYPVRRIDIVFLQAAAISLQYSAIKDGKVLFEEDPTFTADYEWWVLNEYLDFQPVLEFFDRVSD